MCAQHRFKRYFGGMHCVMRASHDSEIELLIKLNRIDTIVNILKSTDKESVT